jgi:hypothetical protein
VKTKLLRIVLLLASVLLGTVSSPASTAYGCGTGDRSFHNLTGEECGFVVITLSAPATGVLRVVGAEWTGDLYVMVLNSSAGAHCVGEGQEGHLWGCDASGSYLKGMPNYGLPADADYGTTRVSLTKGVFKLSGSAGPWYSNEFTGRWRVELVLD